MARATVAGVCAVIETALTNTQILACIESANVMVTEYLGSTTLSSTLLAQIEQYVAAHFVTLNDPRTSREAADGVQLQYEGAATGVGLMSSRYGQMAIALDTTGTLGRVEENATKVPWMAKAGSESTNTSAPNQP